MEVSQVRPSSVSYQCGVLTDVIIISRLLDAQVATQALRISARDAVRHIHKCKVLPGPVHVQHRVFTVCVSELRSGAVQLAEFVGRVDGECRLDSAGLQTSAT